MVCKSIVRLYEGAIFRLRRGLEGVQSLDLGEYSMVGMVEGYEAHRRKRMAPGDHLVEAFVVEGPCVKGWLTWVDGEEGKGRLA